MRTTRAFLAFSFVALALGACGKKENPCAGISEGCIAAVVSGNVGQIDQLRITLVQPQPITRLLPQQAASSFSLPVSAAIVPPAGLAGQTVSITIEGLIAGNLRAAAPLRMVTVPAAGEHITVEFTLVGPDTADLSLADLAGADFSGGNPDIGPGVPHLVADVNPINFPDTARGASATSMPVMLSNPSEQQLTFAPNSPMSDNNVDFEFGSSGTTCPMSLSSFDPHQSCVVFVTFHPLNAGLLKSTLLFRFTNAPDFALVATGKGLRAWTAENVGSTTINFSAVHGSGPQDIYAVAPVSGSSVWHWSGGPNWTNVTGSGLSDQSLSTVFALDSTHVWVAGKASPPPASRSRRRAAAPGPKIPSTRAPPVPVSFTPCSP